MPQEMHVVRCYNCGSFQVHIIKKVPKWMCKVCNEKQSVKKVYGRGSGRDCRLLVQDLNRKRLEHNNYEVKDFEDDKCSNNVENKVSSWTEFLSSSSNNSDAYDTDDTSKKYTFERPNKKRKTLTKITTKITNNKISNDVHSQSDYFMEELTSNNTKADAVMNEKLTEKSNRSTIYNNDKNNSPRNELVEEDVFNDNSNKIDHLERAHYPKTDSDIPEENAPTSKWNIFLEDEELSSSNEETLASEVKSTRKYSYNTTIIDDSNNLAIKTDSECVSENNKMGSFLNDVNSESVTIHSSRISHINENSIFSSSFDLDSLFTL